MSERPKVKILVGYHKPATLLKSDIFVPIHLGRALATEASKDGAMSKQDYQWMLDNMIGDDTGDNISELNRYLNELTGIYWAWKNYDKLGNPEYIGFMHYRRHFIFNPEFDKEVYLPYGNKIIKSITEKYFKDHWLDDEHILDFLKRDYDIACVKPYKTKDSVLDNYNRIIPYVHKETMFKTYDIVKKLHPDYEQTMKEYFNGKDNICYNSFIMKKEHFFEYMKWFFPVIFELYKNFDYSNANIFIQREVAFMGERLFGVWVKQKEKEHLKVKYLQMSLIENTDIKEELNKRCGDEISIVMSSDNNYIPYLGVTIESLIKHSSPDKNYTVYVLNNNISKLYQKRLLTLEADNVKIKFVNINPYLNEINTDIFYKCLHFTEATYYRFFIPEMFRNYEKLIYCDCDAIFLADPSELYNIDLGDKLLGVVHDTEIQKLLFLKTSDYYYKTLKLKNPANYFNAGFSIFNIPQCQKFNLTEKCFDTLKKIKTPKFVDQDILNIVCEDRVKFLIDNWNVENHQAFEQYLDHVLNISEYKKYIAALEKPKFLHFTSERKPWYEPNSYNADLWWSYARKTPFYEEIIQRMCVTRNELGFVYGTIYDIKHYKQNVLKYWKYKLLRNFVWGKTKERYIRKKHMYKDKIRNARPYIR